MPEVGHCRKKGHSKYPVKPGTIVKILEPLTRWNAKVNARVPHTLYIWVQGVKGKQENVHPPKLRTISVLYFYVPVADEFREHCLAYSKYVQQESIVKQMKDGGYEVIDKQCNFWNNDASWESFYKKIGYEISAST